MNGLKKWYSEMKPMFGSLAFSFGAGAVAAIFVGFMWGGWVLGSTADRMAAERTDKALVTALAPVCADKFAALPDAASRTASLKKAESWKRDDFIPTKLITLPGASYQSSSLLNACYDLIVAPPKPAVADKQAKQG